MTNETIAETAAHTEFRKFLQARIESLEPFQREVMRHEMSAASNRQKIAGSHQGVHSFDTNRWMWLVAADSAPLTPKFGNLQILIVSALQDGDIELFHQAKQAGLIHGAWKWANWADGFKGSASELLEKLDSISEVRQVAGAACLACISNPNAVSTELLDRYSNVRVWSLVFHRLLSLGLQSENAATIARYALDLFTKQTDMLFITDVDSLLARLIRADNSDALLTRIKPFERAIGEDSRLALSEYHLGRGQHAEAAKMVADIRLLSPALPRAALISALAALEQGDPRKAKTFIPFIEDPATALKIQTRIAQLEKNHAAELAALTDLHQLCPDDGETFMQLLTVLKRIGQHELATQLCLKNQELFLDEPEVMAMIHSII